MYVYINTCMCTHMICIYIYLGHLEPKINKVQMLKPGFKKQLSRNLVILTRTGFLARTLFFKGPIRYRAVPYHK